MAMEMKAETPDQEVRVQVGVDSYEVTEADTAMDPQEFLEDKLSD